MGWISLLELAGLCGSPPPPDWRDVVEGVLIFLLGVAILGVAIVTLLTVVP